MIYIFCVLAYEGVNNFLKDKKAYEDHQDSNLCSGNHPGNDKQYTDGKFSPFESNPSSRRLYFFSLYFSILDDDDIDGTDNVTYPHLIQFINFCEFFLISNASTKQDEFFFFFRPSIKARLQRDEKYFQVDFQTKNSKKIVLRV